MFSLFNSFLPEFRKVFNSSARASTFVSTLNDSIGKAQDTADSMKSRIEALEKNSGIVTLSLSGKSIPQLAAGRFVCYAGKNIQYADPFTGYPATHIVLSSSGTSVSLSRSSGSIELELGSDNDDGSGFLWVWRDGKITRSLADLVNPETGKLKDYVKYWQLIGSWHGLSDSARVGFITAGVNIHEVGR